MSQPKITDVSVYSPTTNRLKVIFDQPMKHDATFFSNANWTITGGLSVSTVQIFNASAAIVWLNAEMRTGDPYTLMVANVTNEASEIIDPSFDEYMFLGAGSAPVLNAAFTNSETSIVIGWTEAMTMAPLLNLNNWTVESFPGSRPVDITNITLLSPATIQIIFNREMTQDGGYRLLIDRDHAKDLAGNSMLSEDQIFEVTFGGQGTRPQVTSATLIDGFLYVDFSEPMMPDNEITSRLSYLVEAITPGSAPVFVKSVSIINDTRVKLEISETTSGANYEVAADGMRDLAYNTIDPFAMTASFVGAGQNPRISQVIAVGPNRVDVVFSERMFDNLDIRNPAKYTFTNGLQVISATLSKSDNKTVQLVTSEWVPNVEYALTVDTT